MRALGLVLVLTACVTTATTASTSIGSDSTTQAAPSTTVAPPGWVELAPMTVARSEHPAVVLGDEIVVIGGFIEPGLGRVDATSSVEAYSTVNDTWRDLPDLPEPRHHGMATAVGQRLFVIGGYTGPGEPMTTVWELVGDSWAVRAQLPIPVAAGAAVALDGSIFVVGGTPQGGLQSYDLSADTWTTLQPPSRQREHVAGVALDGELWAIAGRWGVEIFDTTEVYDPGANSWRPGPTLGAARSGFGATVVEGGIVVAGGEVFDPNQALASVERLDPTSLEWSSMEPLPYGLHGNPLVAVGTDIYLPGGSTVAADIENDGRTYRLSTD